MGCDRTITNSRINPLLVTKFLNLKHMGGDLVTGGCLSIYCSK